MLKERLKTPKSPLSLQGICRDLRLKSRTINVPIYGHESNFCFCVAWSFPFTLLISPQCFCSILVFAAGLDIFGRFRTNCKADPECTLFRQTVVWKVSLLSEPSEMPSSFVSKELLKHETSYGVLTGTSHPARITQMVTHVCIQLRRCLTAQKSLATFSVLTALAIRDTCSEIPTDLKGSELLVLFEPDHFNFARLSGITSFRNVEGYHQVIDGSFSVIVEWRNKSFSKFIK